MIQPVKEIIRKRKKGTKFAVGRRVRVKATAAMRAWGYAGQRGTITFGDPRGVSPYIRTVELDSGLSILETKGVHIEHLEVIE